MRKIIAVSFFLTIATIFCAEKRYWYMRKNGSVFMISKEKMNIKGKLEFYQEKKPSMKQIREKLKEIELKNKQKSEETKRLRKYYSQEREIELLRWAVKCLIEKKPIPKNVKIYLKKIDELTPKDTEIVRRKIIK